MGDPYLGQILAVGFNFPPVGWATCNGQLLQIAEYDALFNLLGTTYGGDGITTFGLPNLQGQVPIHVGQGQGLSAYVLGQVGGFESVALTTGTMPQHSHALAANNTPGTANTPGQNLMLATESGPGNSIFVYNQDPPADLQNLSPNSIRSAGQSAPHENRQPYLAINYIIATAGVYPPQS